MITRLGYAGTTTNLQIVLNTQKSPYLNQATQKNTCQIFLPKISWNQKFQTQKNPSIIPITRNPKYPSWGFNDAANSLNQKVVSLGLPCHIFTSDFFKQIQFP